MERRSGDTKSDNPTRQISPKREVNGHKPPPTQGSDPFIDAVLPGQEDSRNRRRTYSVLEVLDWGGMGKIYRAVDNTTDETVVVKTILEDTLRKTENALPRFYLEVQAAMSIDNPHVIKITDFGTYGENAFYVMEYLPGSDLKKITLSQKGRKLPSEWLMPVMLDVCEGMQAAHAKGVIHRDLSPDNIRIANIGGETVVKVIDFGLAKFMQTGGSGGITIAGTLMGKADYMAPEQVLKAFGVEDPVEELKKVRVDRAESIINELGAIDSIDGRVDIYSLGVIMYTLLCGEVPFKHENDYQRMLMRLSVDPKRPREIEPLIPEDLEKVILRAMERDRDKRYQTMGELRAAIAACLPEGSRSGVSSSEDFVLSNILNGLDRSDEKAPAMKLELEEKPPAIREAAPEEEPPKRSGRFRRFIKWTAILAIAGGVSFGAYQYRHEIERTLHELKDRLFGRDESPNKPAPTHSARDLTSAAPQSQYLVTIESVPAGATVQELLDGRRNGRKVYLGTTPLQRRFPEGEHVLLVSKPRAGFQIVTVSPSQPTARVNLARGGAKSPRAPAASGGEGQTLPDEQVPESPQPGENPATNDDPAPEGPM